MPPTTPPTLTLYLTGASSTGKSTLLQLLLPLLLSTLPASTGISESESFPITLHPISQDDFFLPEPLLPPVLPPHTDPQNPTEKNWDAPESLDWPRYLHTLHTLKTEGRLPDGHVSYEVTPPPLVVPEATLAALREKMRARVAGVLPRLEKEGLRIVLVDGFLLLPPPGYVPDPIEDAEVRKVAGLDEGWRPAPVPGLEKVWDRVLFLQADYRDIKKRRESRPGYATVEGWWKDPEGYFERVVWPGYVKSHGWLYKSRGQGAEEGLGELDEEVLREWGIKQAESEWGMEKILEWAVGEIGDLIVEKMGDGQES
ncbi:hypothetical protein BJ508DRAFT_377879 [Ascobolus immersus RN42]|uniref:P-loop containing nucleoside triphosphate hydrolase protein n=1 Tax=Ascobolus immersus RN42 TaxID=1160509 RepID=A0A3N4IBF5_ASCIM|nr:hypothetical protein BJ508DRAFT_377879 [Ascobolus immersus RN42]